MFSWFNASEEVALGNRLAEYYDQGWRELERKTSHKQEDKRRRLIAQVLEQAQQFGATHKLNVYKKAKLGNAFKWTLTDLGHDKDLVDLLAKDILLALR